jgi:hypothetical protein
MPQDPNWQFDQTVLDKIEQSPTGAVPGTPAYQDALKRLAASHQVYADADHKDGYVTARSLVKLPSFYAGNLESFLAGSIDISALETNASIFDRYVQSLPTLRRLKAEGYRMQVAGRPPQHRKHGGTPSAAAAHDPVHTIFLIPGTGPHPGLPGNYLHGHVFHAGGEAGPEPWVVHIHDNDDGAMEFNAPNIQEALSKLTEVLASAPFKLDELESLGFVAK